MRHAAAQLTPGAVVPGARRTLSCLAAACALFIAGGARAESTTTHPVADSAAPAPLILLSEEGPGAEDEFGPGHTAHQDLAVFLGITDDRAEEEFSVGLEYEYRKIRWFGFGGLADYAGGDIRATILMPAVLGRRPALMSST